MEIICVCFTFVIDKCNINTVINILQVYVLFTNQCVYPVNCLFININIKTLFEAKVKYNLLLKDTDMQIKLLKFQVYIYCPWSGELF